MVPAMAVPNDEPRLETLRDNPETSPCWSSGNADCTTLTDGVSMTPRPSPTSSRPGVNAHSDEDPGTRTSSSTMPTVVVTNPVVISDRCAYLFASRPATSDDARMPSVAAVKITPVSIALWPRTTCRYADT